MTDSDAAQRMTDDEEWRELFKLALGGTSARDLDPPAAVSNADRIATLAQKIIQDRAKAAHGEQP